MIHKKVCSYTINNCIQHIMNIVYYWSLHLLKIRNLGLALVTWKIVKTVKNACVCIMAVPSSSMVL